VGDFTFTQTEQGDIIQSGHGRVTRICPLIA
jgi:hypothetical protein